MIEPGSTIGIIGGGQLGRMLALAAASMGYRVHVFAPEAELPAGDVAAEVTRAGYDDMAALDRFAATVDVVTFEFENIDTAAIARVAAQACRCTLRRRAWKWRRTGSPKSALSRRWAAARRRGAPVDSRADLDAAIAELGCPCVLKTRRLGYDGKGQARIHAPADADAGLGDAIAGQPAILGSLGELHATNFRCCWRAARMAKSSPGQCRTTAIRTASSIPAVCRRRPRSRCMPAAATALADQGGRSARPCRRVDAGILRHSRWAALQRNGAARPQQRPLDDRGRPRLAVRKPYPRRLRPAAGIDRIDRARSADEEPARRRCP